MYWREGKGGVDKVQGVLVVTARIAIASSDCVGVGTGGVRAG